MNLYLVWYLWVLARMRTLRSASVLILVLASVILFKLMAQSTNYTSSLSGLRGNLFLQFFGRMISPPISELTKSSYDRVNSEKWAYSRSVLKQFPGNLGIRV